MRRPPLGRLVVLLLMLLLSLGGIFTRLVVLQVSEAKAYTALGYDQRVQTLALSASRGRILDRSFDPLALSLDARDIYADPRYVEDPYGTAQKLAALLGLKVRDLVPELAQEGSFVYIDRQVDKGLASKVAALGLPGIGFLPVSKRYYPAGALAPQVLGSVNVDGLGASGLELQLQRALAGSSGERTVELDPAGHPIVGGVFAETAPVAGADLVTTIDRNLQYQAQEALAQAVRENHALGGTVIVMNPQTGDVYAMATYPWFDPNDITERDLEYMRNRALTDVYEPGSVNKVITVAAAIEEGAVSLEERFSIASQMRVGDFVIHDSHPHPLERMTIGDILAESSNIGAIHVAQRVGEENMASYLSRFGFGRTTGLGFPGESAGIMLPLYQWSDTSLATMAYGQGVSVTPMQMANVYATIANKGLWVQPRLIRGTVDADGTYHPAPASPTRRVVSRGTARSVTQMLAYAVEYGTGEAAQVPGYQVAGKTGTARKPYLDRAGYAKKYVASFIGFLPASDPKVVIFAMLDEPSTVYGGIAAAPLFQKVARYAIQRFAITPSRKVPLPPHALDVG